MDKYFYFSKKNHIYLVLILLIIISFAIGFFVQENSAGGGNINELRLHWENFQIFLNNDFISAINITKGGKDSLGMAYTSSRSPLLSIIQAFVLSPFNLDKTFIPEKLFYFKFVTFFLSAFIPILFFFCLKKKFIKTPNYLLALLSCTVLFLSPYFRTSAFWGFGENYTFITMLLSYYFLHDFLSKKENEKISNLKTKIFNITFFSSLCVYFDVKAIVIPFLCYLIITISNISLKNKLLTTLYYGIFSLPFILLMYIWEGPIPFDQINSREFGSKLFLENVGYSISIIGFYILPLLFFKFKSIDEVKYFFFSKKFYVFLAISLFYLINLNISFDFNHEIFLGKGFLHKIIELAFENQTLKIVFTNIGFFLSFFIIFLYFDKKLDYFIILFFVATSSFSSWLFQEYFDPIILLLAFTFFSTKIFITQKNTFILFIYQGTFLASAIFYYSK